MISIEHIAKQYDDRFVLTDVSFKVKEGTVFGLVGKNGAGKTTLLNIIAGLIKPSSGIVALYDKTVSFLPDVPEYFDFLSCKEYLEFLSIGRCQSSYLQDLLRMVALQDNPIIKTMSRGMKQRLGIAATLIGDPDIILLDEPTSALDPSGRLEVADIISNLKAHGKTVILSTHNLNDMEKICDEVSFLHNGKISLNIDVKQLAIENEYRVCFERPLEELELNIKPSRVINAYEAVYVINSANCIQEQSAFFNELSKAKVIIKRISNETKDLESLFREVCI